MICWDRFFTDYNTGTACRSIWMILKTTDEATIGFLSQVEQAELLAGVSFADANHGTAVGAFGTIVERWTGETTGG